MIAQLQKTLFILFAVYVTTFFISSTEVSTPVANNSNAFLNNYTAYSNDTWEKNRSNFEGIITQINTTMYDTVKYMYYVTDTAVRVDVINKYNETKNTLIFDFIAEIAYVVDYDKEVYKVYKNKNSQLTGSELELKICDNSKKINNYDCFLWRINDEELDTEISYWVNGKSFSFYSRMLSIWNKKDKKSNFFLCLKDNEGVLPMQILERTKLREIISESKIIKIENSIIDKSVVTIPEYFTAI